MEDSIVGFPLKLVRASNISGTIPSEDELQSLHSAVERAMFLGQGSLNVDEDTFMEWCTQAAILFGRCLNSHASAALDFALMFLEQVKEWFGNPRMINADADADTHKRMTMMNNVVHNFFLMLKRQTLARVTFSASLHPDEEYASSDSEDDTDGDSGGSDDESDDLTPPCVLAHDEDSDVSDKVWTLCQIAFNVTAKLPTKHPLSCVAYLLKTLFCVGKLPLSAGDKKSFFRVSALATASGLESEDSFLKASKDFLARARTVEEGCEISGLFLDACGPGLCLSPRGRIKLINMLMGARDKKYVTTKWLVQAIWTLIDRDLYSVHPGWGPGMSPEDLTAEEAALIWPILQSDEAKTPALANAWARIACMLMAHKLPSMEIWKPVVDHLCSDGVYSWVYAFDQDLIESVVQGVIDDPLSSEEDRTYAFAAMTALTKIGWHTTCTTPLGPSTYRFGGEVEAAGESRETTGDEAETREQSSEEAGEGLSTPPPPKKRVRCE